MRLATLMLTAALAACAGDPPPPPGMPQNDAEWAALNARNAEARRLRGVQDQRRQQQAQVFGMEWRMTRLAMECDDPDIRRAAYATARQQQRYFDSMARTRPDLAQISAHEDTRATGRTAGLRPTPAQCRRLLTVMGESVKAMNEGDR